ncbi:MAG TPA: hypothetical protein VN946_24890 [Terriglobales bacterium]|jgi:hypothetical protein|nr:hypothetical protein [Terriglobales bacterium]
MVIAALLKLIDDAGGTMTLSVAEMLKVGASGSLAMALSDDDKILTLTRLKGGEVMSTTWNGRPCLCRCVA